MEQRIKDRYSESIPHEARRRYGIAAGDIELLNGFESYIYEFRRGSDEFILRIGHSLRRSPELIKGEIDWINYLARGGASVARAVSSQEGRLVEEIDDGQGGCFLATAFVKAPGTPPWKQPNGESPEFYERYGRLLGRMHALAKTYQLPDPSWRRPEWDADVSLEIADWLPKTDSAVLQRFDELMGHLNTLPRDDPEAYGMIHQDAHRGNMFLDESGQITLFDFDDCVYSWYIYDLAMVIFYVANGKDDMIGYTSRFLTHFLPGYRAENRLDPVWLAEIPHFLKLREIDLYALIHRSFDVDNLEDPWCAKFMNGRRERIENDVPFIDFDFESLVDQL